MTMNQSSSLNADDVARFSNQAQEWWDPQGPFRALHEMGPLRLDYIKQMIASHQAPNSKGKWPLKNLSILDIGCGGGLLAEPLAGLGASVTGLDASTPTIEIAKAHAAQSGLSIDYRVGTAEEMAKSGKTFDVITAFEIVEHVANLTSFMKAVSTLLKPGGLLLLATMNRTKRSFLLGVVMAEYVLGWVPPGTHDWDRFVKPSEMTALWGPLGLNPLDISGVVYSPLTRSFRISKGNAAVNYFMVGKKVNNA